MTNDALLASLQRLLDAEARMTPGPLSVARLAALLRFGRKNTGAWDADECADLFGAEAANGNLPDDDDAQGIAALRNVARPLLEALIALLRLHFYGPGDTHTMLQREDALQRLAEALNVQNINL